MAEQKSNVSFAESSHIVGRRLGEFIQREIASRQGMILTECQGSGPIGPRESDAYGIVLVNEGDTCKRFRFLFPAPRLLIGNIWIRSGDLKTTQKKWVIEVFGREHTDFFKELATKLAHEFNVEIHIRLESEQPKEVRSRGY